MSDLHVLKFPFILGPQGSEQGKEDGENVSISGVYNVVNEAYILPSFRSFFSYLFGFLFIVWFVVYF